MNSAVSTPSRPTARNASITTASAPVSSARDMPARSSPEMLAAALRIHNTIVVTIATATSEATPATASAASPLTL